MKSFTVVSYLLALYIYFCPHAASATPAKRSPVASLDILDQYEDFRKRSPSNVGESVPASQKRGTKTPSSGLFIYPGTCGTQDQATLETAIGDAGLLAGAGLNAAANFSEMPFRYFFKDDAATANIVGGVLQRVQQAVSGQGPRIIATCWDKYKYCKTGDLVAGAYVVQERGHAPVVVFCLFSLRRNPTPCTQRPGAISLGSQMLHELTHIDSISGFAEGDGILDISGETAREVNDDLDDGVDTTRDANAYAHLGSWAWDLGLGGPGWKSCLNRFPLGQFDLEGLDASGEYTRVPHDSPA